MFNFWQKNCLGIQILFVEVPCSKVMNWNFSSVNDHWVDQWLQLWIDFVLIFGNFWSNMSWWIYFDETLIMKTLKPPSSVRFPAKSQVDKQVEKLHLNEIELRSKWSAENLFFNKIRQSLYSQTINRKHWCNINSI